MTKTHLTLTTSQNQTTITLTRVGTHPHSGQPVSNTVSHKLSQKEIRQLVKTLASLMR